MSAGPDPLAGEAQTEAQLVGRDLGPYHVLSLAGAGGMGNVYKARDTRLGRMVAIKVIAAHVASDRQFLERFHREARAIAAVSHPNICTLYDVGRHEDLDFIVMRVTSLGFDELSKPVCRLKTGRNGDLAAR